MLVAMVVQSLSPILRGLAGLLPLHTLVGGLLQRLHSLLSISAVLSLALLLLTVTLIYTYVPGGKRRIRDQLPGAAAVVAVWTLFSLSLIKPIQTLPDTPTGRPGSFPGRPVLLLSFYCFL